MEGLGKGRGEGDELKIVLMKRVDHEDLPASEAGEKAMGEDGEGTADAASEESAAVPSLVPANMNVQKVLQEQKDKRDAAQKQTEAKKAKDKEDREKQKNQKVDKAESEKKRTQKGERRR